MGYRCPQRLSPKHASQKTSSETWSATLSQCPAIRRIRPTKCATKAERSGPGTDSSRVFSVSSVMHGLVTSPLPRLGQGWSVRAADVPICCVADFPVGRRWGWGWRAPSGQSVGRTHAKQVREPAIRQTRRSAARRRWLDAGALPPSRHPERNAGTTPARQRMRALALTLGRALPPGTAVPLPPRRRCRRSAPVPRRPIPETACASGEWPL